PELKGLIRREDLGKIRGRSRKDQLKMAQEFGIENPPNAGGGCLLTDPAFAIRVKDLFKHIETPTTNDIDLLKIGRHFRLDENTKLIVGRNKDENEIIKALALDSDVLLEAKDNVGPISLVRGKSPLEHVEIGAAVTLRYGDAPKNTPSVVIIQQGDVKSEVSNVPALETAYLQYRI
ncbi:MAG: tRNA (5-methylaminomethyl-2-thiouridylate)-methyltransferase, partial [Nitrosopumilaceae archaeon]